MFSPNSSSTKELVPSDLFIEIARELLSEPHARENHFKDLTLNEIAQALEVIDGEESAPENFAQCKGHYCMLLMEMELQGLESIPPSWNNLSLGELAKFAEPETKHEMPPESPPLIEQEVTHLADTSNLAALNNSELESADLENINSPLVPQIELTNLITDLTDGELAEADKLNHAVDISDQEAPEIIPSNSPDAMEPTMISSDFTHLFNEEASPLSSTLDPEEPKPAIQNIDEHTNTVTDLRSDTIEEIAPPIEGPPISFSPLEITGVSDLPVELNPEPSFTLNAPMEPSPSQVLFAPYKEWVQDSLAKCYLNLAIQFHETLEGGTSQISVVILRKLIGQFLCSVAETEVYSRLMPSLVEFWPNRKDLVKSFIKPDAFQLIDPLTSFIARQSEVYEDWLYEGKFPAASILSSLRYIILTENLAKLSPSSLDLGMLIYFFAYPRNEDSQADLPGLPLSNSLKFNGISSKETTELAFRLLRIERLKAKALDSYCHFDNDHVEAILDDLKNILTLIGKVKPELVQELHQNNSEEDPDRDVA